MNKTMKTNRTTPTAGRPKGTKNAKHPQVDGELTVCPKCQSTARGPYKTKEVTQHGGERNGKPYTEVWFRRSECTSCGQHRIDKHYVNNPGAEE